MPYRKQRQLRPLVSPAQVRRWAKRKGIDIPSRGRIPLEIENRYRHGLAVSAGRRHNGGSVGEAELIEE